jgi:hypothetical protein
MLKKKTAGLLLALVSLPICAQSADPAEVDAVVAAIKSANPDLKALCQKGPDGIRKASTEAVMGLVASGKVKGNPQAAGGEAGQKVGRECRGG